MKAVRLHHAGPIEQGPLTFDDLPDPTPGPGEVLLKVKACGVCRTDLHVAEGDVESKPPIIPGHQVVGVVEALGPGTHKLKVGDRVGACWLNWACGECLRCKEGNENLCPRALFTGLTSPGGFAERMAAPEAFLHKLPARYSDAEAAPLLCAGASGWRAYKACKPHKGERLGLYGFGASAHLVLQFARHAGLEVFVFTKSKAHRESAEKLGAFWVGGVGDHLPFSLDSAILFAPSGKLVPAALEALRPGGRLLISPSHMTDIPSMPFARLWGERSVRSVANVTRADVHGALGEAEHFHLKVEVESFALSEASKALFALKKGKLGSSAALMTS